MKRRLQDGLLNAAFRVGWMRVSEARWRERQLEADLREAEHIIRSLRETIALLQKQHEATVRALSEGLLHIGPLGIKATQETQPRSESTKP